MTRYHSPYMSMNAPTATGTSSIAATRINYSTNGNSSPAVKKQVRFKDNIKSNSDSDRIKELGKRMSKEQEEKYARNNTGTLLLTHSFTYSLTQTLGAKLLYDDYLPSTSSIIALSSKDYLMELSKEGNNIDDTMNPRYHAFTLSFSHSLTRSFTHSQNSNQKRSSWVSKVVDTDAEETKLREVYESGFTDMFRREKGISPQERLLKQSYNGQKALTVKKKH